MCEKHYNEANGTIKSRNYPNGSEKPFKCKYVINGKRTYAIRIKFNYIGLKTDIRTCFYDLAKHDTIQDYIQVYYYCSRINVFFFFKIH